MFKHNIHDSLILDEIQYIVENKKPESRTVEYKSQLPDGSAQGDINCMLKPACSFANSNDGYIIYGVTEIDNLPNEITGIAISDIDKTKQRLENLLRNNIEDQLNGIDIAAHPIKDKSTYILIMSVKKSWYGPHRVTKNYTFYGRNSAGSYPMDMAEIRSAVTMSAGLLQNIDKFIVKRVVDIQSGKSVVPLLSGATVTFHLLPISAFTLNVQSNMSELAKLDQIFLPKKYRYTSWQRKIVLEGFLGRDDSRNHSGRYDLVFRNGVIESVSVFPPKEFVGTEFQYVIGSQYLEDFLIDDANRFFEILKILGFSPPFVLSLTVTGLAGYHLGASRQKIYPFDRDHIQLKSGLIESFDMKVENVLKDLFDPLWHSCGLQGSENFDEAGERVALPY